MKLKHLIFPFVILLSCNSLKTKNQKRSNLPSKHVLKKTTKNNLQTVDFVFKDTIYIGQTRKIKSLHDYFSNSNKRDSVYLLIDPGTYYSNEMWIKGDFVTIEGRGQVNLYCTELHENVMWISGNHITVKNMRMKHFAPGNGENQNCSGRVIAFDNANHIVIEGCDLNGCGLAGLHDNLGNSDILIRNNYIHNNLLGAYTDIDGRVWLEETKGHDVFTFENNRMENNGPNRTLESNSLDSKITLLEKLNMYLINEGKVGNIQIGDWINTLSIEYPIELIKSKQVRTTEEGKVTEPIYILTQEGTELFKITCAFNASSREWEDKVGEINIINPKFETEKNIGVNNTVSEFLKAYPDAKFFYTYISDRFWCTTESLKKMQFKLSRNSFLGNIDLFSSDLIQIESKDFKTEGEIISVRIY